MVRTFSTALACAALLFVCATRALAAFPAPYVWWDVDSSLSWCQVSSPGVCKTFTDENDVCFTQVTPPFYSNVTVKPTVWNTYPNRVFSCWAAYSGCNPPGSLCGTGHNASERSNLNNCPKGTSTFAAGNCTCKAGWQQVGNSCSGAKNNSCSAANPTIGNPCNAANGNKFHREPIYRGSGVGALEMVLSFNTDDPNAVAFGKRWRHSYDRKIVAEGANYVVHRGDGKAFVFTPSGGGWVTDADTPDVLIQTTSPAGWEWRAADREEVETYSSAGRLLSIAARSGLAQTFVHSDGTSGANGGFVLDSSGNATGTVLPAGLLIRATDPFGRVFAFGYNSASRVIKANDPDGGIYRFGYDLAANLTSVTFPDAKLRAFHYNESANTGGANLPNALTGITDEKGLRFATYKYNSDERVTSTEHAGTVNRYQFSYSAGSTTVTDPRSSARTYSFSTVLGAFKNTGVSGGACPSCGPASRTYDANGNVATSVDWNGNRTNYTYDLARNLETARTEALTSGGSATAQTRTITTTWHSTFRLRTGIAEPLRITTFTYDATGSTCGAAGALCSKSVQATTDTNGSSGFSATTTGSPRTWTYTYNANGLVLTVDGPRTDVSDVTTYTYYADNDATVAKRGNVATVTNAAGHVTSITSYNAHGQPLTIIDANGRTTTLAYDARRRLTSRVVGAEITDYDYDDAGQLTRVTLPDGSYLLYTYDNAHRLTEIADNLGNRITYTLDVMGNRTLEQVRDPLNSLVQTRSRVYSSLNRLFQELGATSQTTEYTYDNQGNVLTVKDPLLRVTTNQYDALNRLKQVTDPGAGVTQYGYDGVDQLASVSDPRTLVTTYAVNGLGNLSTQVSPDTGTTANTFDAAGNLLTQTDAKSQVTTYAYDVLNRVTQITFHDGSKQVYVYDQGTNSVGRLSSITERDPPNAITHQTSYTYDLHGRVTLTAVVHAGVTYNTVYGYDGTGRLSSLTYPSGRTLAYLFDNLGRVSAINSTLSGHTRPIVAGVAYHPFGGVKSYTLGNGQTYTRSIDQDGRIDTYTLGAQSFGIGYDAASRIEFISDLAVPANINNYVYDALDRLTEADTPVTDYQYTYDATGNRLTRLAGASTDTYAIAPTNNRISTITPPSGPIRTFTFDANGSTTADGNNTYVYDVKGRMSSATSGLGTTSYKVNALGQRIRKTNSLADTVFHYDTGGRLISETTTAGVRTREVLYLGDIPVGVVQ